MSVCIAAAVHGALSFDLCGKGFGVKTGLGTPCPVAAQLARGVQVRLGTQTQPVVHGNDGSIRHRAQRRPQQCGARGGSLDGCHLFGGGLAGGQVQIGRSGGFFLFGSAVLPPVGQGGVVVGAGVDHAVLDVVMGQILVVPAAEGELQHLHAREGAVGQQLAYAGEQLAQVLGDDGQLAQCGFQCVEQLHAGAVLPLAGAGGGAGGRDGPVGVKAAEVVDAQQVIDAQCVAHPAHPPGVAGLFVVCPVVQGVAPQLAVCGEVVRRAARHPGKAAVGVQLKQFAAHPCIHRVGRDVDGDIAQNLHTLLVGVGLDRLPLDAELVLHKLPEADLFLVCGSKGGQRSLVAAAVGRVPLHPVLHLVGDLQRHVQGIVVQPVLVGKGKGVVVIGVVVGTAVQPGALAAPCGVGLAQHRKAADIQSAVVHFQRIFTPAFRFEVCGGQQTFFFQRFQVHKIGVARKGRAALVGAVAVAGGAERQQLPDRLSCRRQEIHKLKCRLAKAADPVRAGQTGYRHQNTTFTHDPLPSSLSIFGNVH